MEGEETPAMHTARNPPPHSNPDSMNLAAPDGGIKKPNPRPERGWPLRPPLQLSQWPRPPHNALPPPNLQEASRMPRLPRQPQEVPPTRNGLRWPGEARAEAPGPDIRRPSPPSRSKT